MLLSLRYFHILICESREMLKFFFFFYKKMVLKRERTGLAPVFIFAILICFGEFAIFLIIIL